MQNLHSIISVQFKQEIENYFEVRLSQFDQKGILIIINNLQIYNLKKQMYSFFDSFIIQNIAKIKIYFDNIKKQLVFLIFELTFPNIIIQHIGFIVEHFWLHKYMINIKGVCQNNLQSYLLQINGKFFFFVEKPDLQQLRYFSLKTTRKNQGLHQQKTHSGQKNKPKSQTQKLEEESSQIKQHEHTHKQNGKVVKQAKLKIHFDLNYLRNLTDKLQKMTSKHTVLIMLTHYQDFIVLPYIIKKLKQKHNLQIYATHIMQEIGRIYMQQFYQKIHNFDMLSTDTDMLTFEEQSKLQDDFYIEHGIQIKTWSRFYDKQSLKQVHQLTIKTNYGELSDVDGVKFKPLPSGHSIGSAIWMLENTLTRQIIMFIKQFSTQNWRSFSRNYLLSCQKQAQKYRQKQIKNIDLLVLGNKSLISQPPANSHKGKEASEIEIMGLMRKIKTNLQKNINTEVILNDEVLILDIIEHINFQMKQKFKSIFIQNKQFNQIVSYANSYVEFLSNQYKQRIYKDPPEYPFEGYLSLRQKGFLSTGALYEIAHRQKLPLKQFINRHTPYIYFKSDYSAFLEGFQPNPNPHDFSTIYYKQRDVCRAQELTTLISSLKPQKTISFTNILPFCEQITLQNIGILQYGKQYSINSESFHYYLSKNISPNIINKYEFEDGYIVAYPVNRQFLRLNSNWKQQLQKKLKQSFRHITQITQKGLKTSSTDLQVKQYEIFIKSKDLREVMAILQIFSAITRTIRLK